MDHDLDGRWRNGESPFAANMISCGDLLRISTLQEALNLVVQTLMDRYAGETVYILSDWHEHDGVILSRKVTSWPEILRFVESEDSLYNSRDRDAYVRIGVYTASRDFFLRYYLPDEDDDPEFYPGRWGDFDLAGSEELLEDVLSLLRSRELGTGVVKTEARGYFNEHWAG